MVKPQMQYLEEGGSQPLNQISSSLVSRNITIMGRRTSVRLEPEMWMALRDISKRERCTIHDICTLVYIRKSSVTSLTAAIRVFLMLYFRAAATEDGHQRAGHGNFDEMKRRARIPEELSIYFKSKKNSMMSALPTEKILSSFKS